MWVVGCQIDNCQLYFKTQSYIHVYNYTYHAPAAGGVCVCVWVGVVEGVCVGGVVEGMWVWG